MKPSHSHDATAGETAQIFYERADPVQCELTIAKVNAGDGSKTVRIDACEGPKLLCRVEVRLEDFAEALMGLGCVPADFRTTRTTK